MCYATVYYYYSLRILKYNSIAEIKLVSQVIETGNDNHSFGVC